MKKKAVLFGALGVMLVLVIAVALWGKQYYDEHYVGSDYYAMIPLGYDVTPGPIYDTNGNEADTGTTYKMTAYNENGEARDVEFNETAGDNPADYPQPGTYLKLSVSKYYVVGWGIVQESNIPGNILENIKASTH